MLLEQVRFDLLHRLLLLVTLLNLALNLTFVALLSRILPLEPRRFEKHLIYHVANNKQHGPRGKKMIRVGDFYGQIITVKERATKFAKEMWSIDLT